MNLTVAQYEAMQKRTAPRSNSKVNIPVAFAVGGTICMIGQLLLEGLLRLGLERQAASGWVSVILVGASALLTGFGLYERLARHAGAGTLVPITCFANAATSAAIEAKTEGLILGVGTKIFTIAGPVILYGCTAAAVYGALYFLANW